MLGKYVMKPYKFKTIINKGRFKEYFYSLSKEEQYDIQKMVNEYAIKYAKYSDTKNLEFLVNLLFVLGAFDALKSRRESTDVLVDELSNAMFIFLKKKVESFNKAFKSDFIYKILKKAISKKMLGFNGHGWEIIVPKAKDNNIYIEVKQCLVHEILKEENKLELGKMFCNADLILYMHLGKTEFKRTETLIKGGSICDMHFIRHNDDNFERYDSI